MLYVGGQHQEMGLVEAYMNAPWPGSKGMAANQDLGTIGVSVLG